MKGKVLVCLLSFFFAMNTFAQKDGAFVIYNAKGKKVSYKKLKKKAIENQVVKCQRVY